MNILKKRKSVWHFFQCPVCNKDSENTREQLLLAAFSEIHQSGFQAASLSNILRRTGLTKGALYHHFGNKHTLGLCVIDEIISKQIEELWLAPLQSGDPITTLIEQIKTAGKELSLEEVKLGCPLNNLTQEMAPLDEEFRQHIEAIYQRWRGGVQAAFERGIEEGYVKPSVNPETLAAMIVATLEGCIGLSKSCQDKNSLMTCGKGLIDVLQTLRNQ